MSPLTTGSRPEDTQTTGSRCPRPKAAFARRPAAFTILEVLVSTVILAMLMGIILSVTSLSSRSLKQAVSKSDAFQAARASFDVMTRSLSQATLNTYWDYYNSGGESLNDSNAAGFVPNRYGRQSDLHFLAGTGVGGSTSQGVFFQSPLAKTNASGLEGFQSLLNSVGYFVEYGDDGSYRPSHVTKSRNRYRLMQAVQPSEDLEVFSAANRTGSAWVSRVAAEAWPLADNIIALIVWPRLSPQQDDNGDDLTTDYGYDSRSPLGSVQQDQLPPMLQVTMIAIDETSAERLDRAGLLQSTVESAVSGKFTSANEDAFRADLEAVEANLAAAKVGYQVFTTSIPLRESKWSRTTP